MTLQKSIGIRSFGAYIPRRRMARKAIAEAHAWALPSLRGQAKGEKSICSFDEDVITMAVEAGRDSLRGHNVKDIQSISLASTSAPFADLQNTAIVAAALQANDTVSTSDTGASSRAALSALNKSCSRGEAELLIASERRRAKPGSLQEMAYGSGAGALLIGEGDDLIAKYLGGESLSAAFFDRFRKNGEAYDYQWEERWIRDEGIGKLVPKAFTRLLEKIDKKPEEIAHFGLSGGTRGGDKFAARKLGIDAEKLLPDFHLEVGNTGVAQPVLQLIAALEKASAGDIIVVAHFAQGVELVAFEMQSNPANTGRRGLAASIADRIPETAYLKMLSFDGEIELDWGMRAEKDQKTALTQQYRSAEQIFGFIGGECPSCQAVQFPVLPACVNCGASTENYKAIPLADAPAKVATITADWLQYSQAPPLYMGLIQFDNGARMLMQVVDVGEDGIDVGTELEMTFRIKEHDKMRNYDRYFWKAVPKRSSK